MYPAVSFSQTRDADTADFLVRGDSNYADSLLGVSFSVGDLNADGIDDILIGASYADPGGITNGGELYLFYGPQSGNFGAAQADVIISGAVVNSQTGVVTAIGDFNSDGDNDIVIGSNHDSTIDDDAGSVSLFYGPFTSNFSLSTADATFHGDAAYQEFGTSLAVGDFGSGYLDLAVGAPGDSYGGSNSGAVYVFYGSSGGFSGDYYVGDEDLFYYGTSYGRVGEAMTVLNDSSNNFLPVVGAPDEGATLSGKVYVVDTTTDGDINNPYNLAISGTTSAAFFGINLSPADSTQFMVGSIGEAFLFDNDDSPTDDTDAVYSFEADESVGVSFIYGAQTGDLDRDGYPDYIVGDSAADYVGKTYVFYSSTLVPGSYYSCSDADVEFLGDDNYDLFGFRVAGGDFNADGAGDVIVGAFNEKTSSGNARGSAYLYYGQLTPFVDEIVLTDADTIFEGDDADDHGGYSVASVGDVNCDGIPDIAVSGVRADEDSTNTGAVYVFFGPTPASDPLEWNNSVFDLSDANLVFYGAAAVDWTGGNLDFVGDLDGDGCDDLLLPAPGREYFLNENVGAVYLIYGDSALAGIIDYTDADATFFGNTADDYFGRGLSGLGDLDNDGYADFIVGARGADGDDIDSGRAYLFYGDSTRWSGLVFTTASDCIFNGEEEEDYAGYSFAGPVSFSGDGTDFNGDGYWDIAISAPKNDQNGLNAGAIYIFYGDSTRFSGTVSLSVADGIILGENSCTLIGGYCHGQLGYSLAGAGDIDNDGYDDFVAGAPYSQYCYLSDPPLKCTCITNDIGRAFWIPGQVLSGTATVPVGGATLSYSYFHSVLFGWSVDAGDVTGTEADVGMGDGSPEIIVGAPYLPDSTGSRTGGAYVFHGSTISSSSGSTIYSNDAEVKIMGEYLYDYAGWSVSVVDDINQSGEGDLLIGAYGSDRGGNLSGAAYVILGDY